MTAELRQQLAARKSELLELIGAGKPMASATTGGTPSALPMPTADEAQVIDRDFDAKDAWIGRDLPSDAGIVPVDSECRAELANLARELAANPLPLMALRPNDFELPACRRLMSDAQRLAAGPLAFAVVDRLDLSTMSVETARSVYWLLASMVARPVAQKWDGTMTYDVTDLGKKSLRAVDTNDELNFHTDNAFNKCAPEYVALLCLQKAMQGGMSLLVSFSNVHNEMRRRAPDLLARLYQPYIFSRQTEHASSEPPTIRHAGFENHGGRLAGRLSRFHVRTGYALAGETLDADGARALDMLEEIMERPALSYEFCFEPGQIQIIDNRRIGHKRTGFIDWPEPERRRRLMRLWLRDEGRPFYNG
jgi:alpha-ketoglutarate-dependent taurine dioxygenase